ncbi:DUF5666 domain-containing protein [Actinoplanes sp. NPDC026619]|uniref:DUF5666 domain-containing protein n=1 Tax=Actinoplanes sp. NPDC026619 TaxID=3155798 RepID=UPI003410F03B
MSDSDTEVLEPPVDEDLPAQLSKAAPRRWFNRATPVLLGVFLLAGGFLGGVGAQKHWGKTSSSGTSAVTRSGSFSGQMPSGMGASGGPGGGFGGGTATVGTIKSISASALTMTTAAGKTITVKIAESTKVQQTITVAKLKAGQSLSVQGSTATDGSITATSVTAS